MPIPVVMMNIIYFRNFQHELEIMVFLDNPARYNSLILSSIYDITFTDLRYH